MHTVVIPYHEQVALPMPMDLPQKSYHSLGTDIVVKNLGYPPTCRRRGARDGATINDSQGNLKGGRKRVSRLFTCHTQCHTEANPRRGIYGF